MAGSLEAYAIAMQVVAAGGAAGFAALLLPRGTRREGQLPLALYLLLIAASLALSLGTARAPLGARGALVRADSVIIALEPLFLLPFVVGFLGAGSPRARALVVRATGFVAGGVAALVAWVPRAPASPTQELLRGLAMSQMGLAYLLAYGIAAVHLARSPHSVRARIGFAALSLALLPLAHAVASLPERTAHLGGWSGGGLESPLGQVIMPLAVLGGTFGIMRARGASGSALGFALGLPALGFAAGMLTHVAHSHPLDATWAGQAQAYGAAAVRPLRWMAFVALASMVGIRYGSLALPFAAQRIAARIVLSMIGAATALTLLASVRATPWWQPTHPLTPVLAFAGGALAVQAIRPWVDVVATRWYGFSLEDHVGQARRAYGRAARRAADAADVPHARARLAALRRRWAIPRSHGRALEREAELASTAPLRVGQRVLARYDVVARLAPGGGGRCHLAHDTELGRSVVLKESRGPRATEERDALRRVAAIGHPNLVAVHDVIPRNRSWLAVMEYVAGGDLAARMNGSPAVSRDEAMRTALDVLAGLAALHRRDLVHGDVSPANILLDATGRAKLGDYGSVRWLRDPKRRTTAPRGTRAFLAPELQRGNPPTPRSDVYAVARVLERVWRSPVPPALGSVLARALAAKPSDRWPDAESFRVQLVRVRSALGRER